MGRVHAIFERLLRRRLPLLAGVLAVTAASCLLCARLRLDQAVESVFPVWHEARVTYDRYRDRFPYDDARAVVMAEAPDLWTPAGLARLKDLEARLSHLPHVIDAEGPLSAKDVTGSADEIGLRKIFPSPEVPQAEIDRRLADIRQDPLFAWRLAHPTRSLASVVVRMEPEAARSAPERRAFQEAAAKLLDELRPQYASLVMSGVPSIRARYIQMVNKDMRTLMPVALLLILAILGVTYRSPLVLAGALVTILSSLLWSFGFMGASGFTIGILTSFAPLVIMVISISDTVHIVTDADERMRRGVARRDAVIEAMADCAGPCLLTELVIAAGFLSLVLVNLQAIVEFGIIAAVGMLITWAANMTVLPLFLTTGAEHPYGAGAPAAGGEGGERREEAGLFLRAFGAFVAWTETQVTHHPGRVLLVSGAILLGAGALASQVKVLHYVYEDLRPESGVAKDLRFAEAAHGGIVPLVIYLEPGPGAPTVGALALEPEAVRFLDAAERRLRALPNAKVVSGIGTYLRKAQRALAGPGAPVLPETRALAAQEVLMLDDGKVFRDILDFDRREAAVVALFPDMPSPEVRALIDDVEAWAQREAPKGYRVSVTGYLAIVNRVARLLVEGLVQSFGTALLITWIVFSLALRSVRLAVVGLIPNVSPMVIIFAVMVALGICIKPTTTIMFSIVLTISDDDTIQYLSRFRRRFTALRLAGHPTPHAEAALATLRESALPMIVTATTVAVGFAVLLLSEFKGNANIGIVMGTTLFAAVFADIFITPILLIRWKPPIGLGGGSRGDGGPRA